MKLRLNSSARLAVLMAASIVGHVNADTAKENRFGPATLTIDDIVGIYHVPVEKSPARKWEWVSNPAEFFRISWEERRPSEDTWTVKLKSAIPTAYRKAFAIYIVEPEAIGTPPYQNMVLRFRIGGENGTFHGWSESQFLIPLTSGSFLDEQSAEDTNSVIVFQCGQPGTDSYRLRIERSMNPFPK